MREIPLSRGLVALVDDEDYDDLMLWKWGAYKDKSGRFYAVRTGSNPKRDIRMHRVIMNAPRGLDVDHIDNDGLNNQKCNLRICTSQQNNCNRRSYSSSGYKGVYFIKAMKSKPWLCTIKKDNVKIHIGYFVTAEDAAHAYDKAAIKYHGEFARINFPEESKLKTA